MRDFFDIEKPWVLVKDGSYRGKFDFVPMGYNGETIRLDGYTDSFEAVNRITQALNKSPLFSYVEISEARMAADGSRVDFQLKIDLIESGGSL